MENGECDSTSLLSDCVSGRPLAGATESNPWLETGLELDSGEELPSTKALASLEEFRLWPGLKLDRLPGWALAIESPRFKPALA